MECADVSGVVCSSEKCLIIVAKGVKSKKADCFLVFDGI